MNTSKIQKLFGSFYKSESVLLLNGKPDPMCLKKERKPRRGRVRVDQWSQDIITVLNIVLA